MKISIVTPVYNGGQYITNTIESILSQTGDFELEYIIVDGKSTDNTLEIAQKYKQLVDEGLYNTHRPKTSMQIISEKDYGMYDALAKGLKLCTGDIIAYQNADDFYYLGAFASAVKLFSDLAEVSVFHGRSISTNADGIIVYEHQHLVNNYVIERGIINNDFSMHYIPQESTFWRKNLLKYIDYEKLKSFTLAGDFYLWYSFAKHAQFYSADVIVSTYRVHEGQLSTNIEAYHAEVKEITQIPVFSKTDKKKLLDFKASCSLTNSKKRQHGLIFFSYENNKYIHNSVEISSYPPFLPIITIKRTIQRNKKIYRVRFLGISIFKIVRNKKNIS